MGRSATVSHHSAARLHRASSTTRPKANALLIFQLHRHRSACAPTPGSAIFGSTIQPFWSVMAFRVALQICHAFARFRSIGMIWRDPVFPRCSSPSPTAHQRPVFFGPHRDRHLRARTWSHDCVFGPIGIVVGLALAAVEIVTLLILRAQYDDASSPARSPRCTSINSRVILAPAVDHGSRACGHALPLYAKAHGLHPWALDANS